MAIAAIAAGLSFAVAAPNNDIAARRRPPPPPVANITVCNGARFVYEEQSGYGFLPSNARDKFGDTMSIGSSFAIDPDSWKLKDTRNGPVYEGHFWGLPDRGWYDVAH